MNHEPRGPEMRPSGWRLRKACVGWLRRERRPNLSEPAKCSQRLAGFRWCSVRSAVWQPAKRYEHFAGAVVHQTMLVRHAIQSVDARRGGALEAKRHLLNATSVKQVTRAQCPSECVSLVLFLVNAPITIATVPRGAYAPMRKSGGFAIWRPAMFRTGLSKRFWFYAGPFF